MRLGRPRFGAFCPGGTWQVSGSLIQDPRNPLPQEGSVQEEKSARNRLYSDDIPLLDDREGRGSVCRTPIPFPAVRPVVSRVKARPTARTGQRETPGTPAQSFEHGTDCRATSARSRLEANCRRAGVGVGTIHRTSRSDAPLLGGSKTREKVFEPESRLGQTGSENPLSRASASGAWFIVKDSEGSGPASHIQAQRNLLRVVS